MGIEPTSHDSRRGSTGFEDQASHQTGRTSEADYSTRNTWFPLPEQVLSNGSDDVAGRRFLIFLEAVTADNNERSSEGFAHGETRRRR